MVAASGEDKEPHKVTFDSNNDAGPRFGPDGKKLFFLRVESTGGNTPNSVQIYSVLLERQDKDPDDPEERETEASATPAEGGEGATPPARRGPPANRPPREIKVDWNGLKRRTRQVTRMPFPIPSFTVAPDSRTILFVTTEPAGIASVPVIYSIQDDGRRLSRITAGQPPNDNADGGPGGGGGFGGGLGDLAISRDGRTLFFRERDGIYSVPLPPSAGAGAGPGPGAGAGAAAAAGAGQG